MYSLDQTQKTDRERTITASLSSHPAKMMWFQKGKKKIIDTFSKKTSDVYRKVKSLTELTSTLCWSTGISESIRFNTRRNSVMFVSTFSKVKLKLKSEKNVVKHEIENTLLLTPSISYHWKTLPSLRQCWFGKIYLAEFSQAFFSEVSDSDISA